MKRFQIGKSTIFLMGVQRYELEHGLRISEYLQIMKPECILTQIQSDHPTFIHSESNTTKTWNDYIRGKSAKFLVRPRPNHIQDILLNSDKIGKFMLGVLLNSKDYCDISSNIAYTRHNSFFAKVRGSTLQPDCFTTGLLYHANNSGTTKSSAIFDMPELIYRDQIARKLELFDLQEFYKQFVAELEDTYDKQNNFDPRTLNAKVMIKPKTDYMAEVMKQIAGTYGLIVAIVDGSIMYEIEESWGTLEENPKNLLELLKISEPDSEITLVEYIEKHVLLEMMLGPFVQEYFVNQGFFPYTGLGMTGTSDGFYDIIKDAWAYYYKTYSNELSIIIKKLVAASHATGSKKFNSPKYWKNHKKS